MIHLILVVAGVYILGLIGWAAINADESPHRAEIR